MSTCVRLCLEIAFARLSKTEIGDIFILYHVDKKKEIRPVILPILPETSVSFYTHRGVSGERSLFFETWIGDVRELGLESCGDNRNDFTGYAAGT